MRVIIKFKKSNQIHILERVNTVSDLYNELKIHGMSIKSDRGFTSGLLVDCAISEVEYFTLLP